MKPKRKTQDGFVQAINHIDGWLNTTRRPGRETFSKAEVQNMLLDLRVVVSTFDTLEALQRRIDHHHEILAPLSDVALSSLEDTDSLSEFDDTGDPVYDCVNDIMSRDWPLWDQ